MILLDTHALLWMDADDPALGPRSRELISAAWKDGGVAVSAITFWEVAMLVQRGRVRLPVAVQDWRADLTMAGVQEIAVDGRIGLAAAALEGLHRDPADRFIVATALENGASLVTADALILGWGGMLDRVDARG